MYDQSVLDRPPFQIHIEPDEPIQLDYMLRELGAIGRQFEIFAVEEGLSPARDAKLLISSVKPGSIDIGLLPDLTTLGSLVAPVLVYSPPVLKFATALKGLVDKFKSSKPVAGTTVKDCNDAIAIANPTAEHGGSQTFNIYNGTTYQPVFVLGPHDSSAIVENATNMKAMLEGEHGEHKQRVPMIWHGLERGAARTQGKRTPDKAIIEEVDERPKPVFFEDNYAHLKKEMLDDHENPYKRVFFVDVAVSRVGGQVVSYKIEGYHGSEELD